MRLASTRVVTYLIAPAALAGTVLAMNAGTTASGQPATSHSSVQHLSGTAMPSPILPGDLRVWELDHGLAGTLPAPLPGDVRMWEIEHPGRE